MTPVRVGVAGVGHWARTAHLPTIAADLNAELVAIADPDPANIERVRRRYGTERTFADASSMFAACDLDAVIVATPHAYHYSIVAEAIERGLHVLVEKPFVLDPADGRRLIDAAALAHLEIVVGYPWHYNRQVLQARDWIRNGRLGEIGYVQSFFGSSPFHLYEGHPEAYGDLYRSDEGLDAPLSTTYSDPRLSGGGQGQTQLTHSIALLHFMTGLSADRVAAFMERASAPVDVVDALAVRFRGGALGAVGSTGAVVPTTHTDTLEYIIHGSRGHLHFGVSEGRLRLYSDEGELDEPVLREEDRYPIWAPARNLIGVVRGAEPNGSPALAAQEAVEILAAAYESAARDGAAVAVAR